MPRYVTRAVLVISDGWGDQQIAGATEVYEMEREIPTGLVSAQGNLIYRRRDTVPMGFHHTPKE